MIFTSNNSLIETSSQSSKAAYSTVGRVLGGYQTGFELVDGAHPDAIERFVVLCVDGSPRLLLPPSLPVMRTAVMCFLGRRRFAKFIPQAINMTLRVGGPFSRVSSVVSLSSQSDSPSPLRELMSGILDRNDFQIALRLSFGRPNAKMVAIAVSDTGEELCYAKFGSESMTNDLVAHEGKILEQFENTEMPMIVPRSLYSGTWAGGHNVLITEPLKLESLNRDAHCAYQAADAFASQNLVATAALTDSAYWHQVIERVEKYDGGEGSAKTLNTTIARIEQVWGDCKLDYGASHGDWSRANLGLVEGRVAALDWERCTEIAPRGIDIAHFALCEKSFRGLDIERSAGSVQQFQQNTGLPPGEAKLLVILALLEMVIRFKSAQKFARRSASSKFESALQAGLQKWAA